MQPASPSGARSGARLGRQVNRLTAKQVKGKLKPGRHADGNNLYLLVDKDGSRRWLFLFKLTDKRREMGLGSLTDVDLADARVEAAKQQKLVDQGIDPIEERNKPPPLEPDAAPLLGVFAKTVINSLKSEWVGKETEKSWHRTFDLYAKAIIGKSVDKIDTKDILLVLGPIWTTLAATAGKARERLERVLDAARAAGHISPPWENPARWKGHLAHLLPRLPKLQRGHHPAMPYKDVPAFMLALAQRQGIRARALEWTILTVAREDMALGARWVEEDAVAKVWTVPEDRMKGRKETRAEFRIPISPQAAAVADRVRPPEYRETEYIFPGQRKGRPLSNAAMDGLLDDMGQPYVPHGFRTSFRDWIAEETSFPRDLAERCMAHVVGDETERAYMRGDQLEKRRELIDAWGRYCAGETVEVRRLA